MMALICSSCESATGAGGAGDGTAAVSLGGDGDRGILLPIVVYASVESINDAYTVESISRKLAYQNQSILGKKKYLLRNIGTEFIFPIRNIIVSIKSYFLFNTHILS